MAHVLAILNHMPVWAASAVIGAILVGFAVGAWLTRDDYKRGLRKRRWLP